MNKYNRIRTFALLKTLFIKIFSSRYTLVLFDMTLTTLISIHTSNINLKSNEWIVKLVFYIAISIIVNFTCIFAGHIEQKDKTIIEYFIKAYDIQNSINCSTAVKLYRINKKISKSIRERKIGKNEINSIVDFQTLSFTICNELHTFITSEFNCGECEITIFQRFIGKANKEFVKMIAYKNNRNLAPSTYGEEFKLYDKTNSSQPVFVKIFNDLNADIKILHNHKSVEAEFVYFDNSKNREQKISQYIGIPIKTNRNKIEIILQIDVSKEKSLGKNYNELKQFSEYIILPFCNLLYCSYERDLIFNKFYDILEENITK